MKRSPRKGYTRKIGGVLFHANWSRSWDGWGSAHKGGYTFSPIAVTVRVDECGARIVSLTVWRFLCRIGWFA